MYIDLRDWLEDVERHSELEHISGVDCHLEMSGICEIIASESKDRKPVVMFDDIPGYQKGFRTLFGILGSPWRVAKTLGFPENKTDRMSLLQNWRKRVNQIPKIEPKLVKDAPVLENIETNNKVDLLKFPAPKLHELDGGRYFGTCHGVIQKDPDTGYVNIGTYRVMLIDKTRLALHILEGQHGSIIMNKKYFSKGKKMPVAIAIGMDPVLWFASCSRIPWGYSEYEYAGGLKGKAMEVIMGDYTGLPIPARAEIVVEGECEPGNLYEEGPFGEWHGYYGNLGLSKVPEPVIDVKAIYYRDNPILTCHLQGRPGLDTSALPLSVSYSSTIWGRLEACGIPGIKGVWSYSNGLFIVVSIEQMYPGHSREVGFIASQLPNQGRYTVVVEEDIDPSDLEQVNWAIVTRGKPDQSIEILHHCRSNSADPTISIEEKKKYQVAPKPIHNARVVIDACRPLEWKKDWYPMVKLSDELRKKIASKWKPLLDDIINKS